VPLCPEHVSALVNKGVRVNIESRHWSVLRFLTEFQFLTNTNRSLCSPLIIVSTPTENSKRSLPSSLKTPQVLPRKKEMPSFYWRVATMSLPFFYPHHTPMFSCKTWLTLTGTHQAGAEITSDLSEASVILGVKQAKNTF